MVSGNNSCYLWSLASNNIGKMTETSDIPNGIRENRYFSGDFTESAADFDSSVAIANNSLRTFSDKVSRAQKKGEPETVVRGDVLFGYNPVGDKTATSNKAHYLGQVPTEVLSRYDPEAIQARGLVLDELGIPETTLSFQSSRISENVTFFNTGHPNVFLGIAPDDERAILPASFTDDRPNQPGHLTERLYFIPDPKILESVELPFDPYRHPQKLRS